MERGYNLSGSFTGQFAGLVTTDPAEFELALRPWELLCKPMQSGTFSHRLVMLQTPVFLIYSETYTLPLHIQGISPPNMLGIGIPFEIGRQAQYWGISHDRGSVPATLPGPLDARVEAGHVQLVVFIDRDLLERELSAQLFEGLVHSARTHQIQLSQAYVQDFAHWINRTLEQFNAAPDFADSPAVIESVVRELIDHLTRLACALSPPVDISNNPSRQRALQTVLEYLRYEASANVSLPELCRIAGVSERSLQYAFREAFDLTPVEFMARRRLHATRRDLLVSRGSNTSVTQIATKFGFTELGRFAAHYKRAFGERPSQTLANGTRHARDVTFGATF